VACIGRNCRHKIKEGEPTGCPHCKKPMSADKYRNSKREHHKTMCQCAGYPSMPYHRRGALFCTEGAAGKAGFMKLDENNPEFGIWYQTYQANKKIPDSEVPF
jgi:hypothetical protein